MQTFVSVYSWLGIAQNRTLCMKGGGLIVYPFTIKLALSNAQSVKFSFRLQSLTERALMPSSLEPCDADYGKSQREKYLLNATESALKY